jgi:hypothetical protein
MDHMTGTVTLLVRDTRSRLSIFRKNSKDRSISKNRRRRQNLRVKQLVNRNKKVKNNSDCGIWSLKYIIFYRRYYNYSYEAVAKIGANTTIHL